MTVHWVGAGREAWPGLRALADEGRRVHAWLSRDGAVPEGVSSEAWDADRFALAIGPGDVAVIWSDDVTGVLDLAIAAQAHAVVRGMPSDEAEAYSRKAAAAGVCLNTQTGVFPGIDHAMTAALLGQMRRDGHPGPGADLSLTSLGGTFPRVPGAFRAGFAAPPVEELSALAAPASLIRAFSPLAVARPWDAMQRVSVPLARPETFEVCPMGDSLSLRDAHGLPETWRLRRLERGTLRLNGWSEAWAETMDRIAGGDDLGALAEALHAAHPVAADAEDRVVLSVSLEVQDGGLSVWHRSWILEAWGDLRGGAVARLGSHLTALAVRAASAGTLPPGLSVGPAGPQMARDWLAQLDTQAQDLREIDHLA